MKFCGAYGFIHLCTHECRALAMIIDPHSKRRKHWLISCIYIYIYIYVSYQAYSCTVTSCTSQFQTFAVSVLQLRVCIIGRNWSNYRNYIYLPSGVSRQNLISAWQPPGSILHTTVRKANGYTFLYNDVTMSVMASLTTSLTIVYSSVYSGADQRVYQSSASLECVRGIHRWPVNSLHIGNAEHVSLWWRNHVKASVLFRCQVTSI